MESRRDGSPKHLVQMGAHQSSSLGRPLRRALHVPGLPFPVHHQIAHAPYLQERHFVNGAHMRGGAGGPGCCSGGLPSGRGASVIRLAYSPCPNDTFIFHAWVSGALPDAPPVREVLLDIDELNSLAQEEGADVVKVSFHALGHLLDRYSLLRSGGALGRGCGPLLVAREENAAVVGRLEDISVAIPGELTTATLLLRLLAPGRLKTVVMPFEQIMPAVAGGEVDAGVIIHESRFTYPQFGLSCVRDLGDWWEETTGHPIPLGGIAVRRGLGARGLRRWIGPYGRVSKPLGVSRKHRGPISTAMRRRWTRRSVAGI